MKFSRSILLFGLLALGLHAADTNIQRSNPGSNLTADFNIGAGREVTVTNGGNIEASGTGTIKGPTYANGTSDNRMATTEFVMNNGGGSPGTVSWGSINGSLSAQADLVAALLLKANLASPAFSGIPTAPTAANGTNTAQLATTAFVLANQSGGGGTWGTITGTLSNQTDLNTALGLKAPTASPTFTGTPIVPTAATDTNTTQAASTAFVIGQSASATPLVNGSAAVGTSTRFARGDHVHPTDTSRAPTASPAFTGVPTAPTAANGTNTTQLATTAFVLANAASGNATLSGNNAFLGNNSFSGITLFTGALRRTFTAMPALDVDFTKWGNSYSASGNVSFTYNGGTPPADGTATRYSITADSSARTITIPSTYSYSRAGSITSLIVPASSTITGEISYSTARSRYEILGDPPATTGSGSFVLSTSPALITPDLGTPSALFLNNATLLPLTGLSGLGTSVGTFLGTPSSANLRAAMTDESGTGALLFAGGALGAATATSINGVTIPSVSDTAALLAAVQTITNKRFQARVSTITSSATPTLNGDTTDVLEITALATDVTSFTTNLSGTPNKEDQLLFRILDNGSARALTWGAKFATRGATLPTTTVAGKYLYVLFLWNSVTSTWDCVSAAQET